MATLNAAYVRLAGASHEIASQVRDNFPSASTELNDSFCAIRFADDDFDPPMTVLESLSNRCGTDVFWLSFQSAADAFSFHLWRSGELVRSLVFGCGKEERTWERATGTPEPWEAEVFFGLEDLRQLLTFIDDESERRALVNLWQEQKLVPGNVYPAIDARGCAGKIGQYYGFPGFQPRDNLRAVRKPGN
jgi:hypothetical protein